MILCTSGDRVRQFMLTAHEMGFINGEYVFMDVDLFIFKVTCCATIIVCIYSLVDDYYIWIYMRNGVY